MLTKCLPNKYEAYMIFTMFTGINFDDGDSQELVVL